VYGPQQIESLISQNPFISSQTTLLGQSGTRVIRGNLLVIPIEETVLYVQPLYLQATAGQGAPTELIYVIVATNEQVEMAPTLAEALGAIVGGEVGTQPRAVTAPGGDTGDTPDPTASLAQQALDSYERAQDALTRGDWAAYGEEQATLESLLTEIVVEAGGPAPVATPIP
jgi:uncharacterized membrane protein (UPF0182 family)